MDGGRRRSKRDLELKPSSVKRIMWMRRRHGVPLINQVSVDYQSEKLQRS